MCQVVFKLKQANQPDIVTVDWQTILPLVITINKTYPFSTFITDSCNNFDGGLLDF